MEEVEKESSRPTDLPELHLLPPAAHRKSHLWDVFGKSVPRAEIVFVCQMIIIYVVIGVSLFSLTRGNDAADKQLWIALLSSCLGYLLPNPRIDPPPTSSQSLACT